MRPDLSNPTKISRLARHLLIATSVVLAVGLSGVVFARAERQRAGVVWIGRGATVPVSLSPRQSSPPAAAADTKVQSAIPVHVDPVPVLRRLMTMEVTAYCPCSKCCGPQAQGITASGKHVSYNNGRFVAADTRLLPFGTKLMIPGYGEAPVEVIDRGGAIKGQKLDVFFATHQEALEWGRQTLLVAIEG